MSDAALLQAYAAQLKTLTFNSKPIITSLTMVAQENTASAAGIASCILDRVKRTLPERRLPLIYLMDSIIKNVGGAYAASFELDVVPLYLATFDHVDAKTKASLEKLLATWRQYRSFPPTLLDHIEAEVESRKRPAMQHRGRRLPTNAGPPPKRQHTIPQRQTVDFSPEALKVHNVNAVHSLYEGAPMQCEFCGFRLQDGDALAQHLDWHFKRNKTKKLRNTVRSCRPYFCPVDEWVTSKIGPTGDVVLEKPRHVFEEAAQETATPIHNVTADEQQPSCPVCHERFVQFWDDDNDAWMVRDAQRTQIDGESKIVHTFCDTGL